MADRIGHGVMMALGLICASTAMAATLDEDEARIEALVQAEHVAAAQKEAARVAAVPVVAEVVAKPISEHDATSNADWLAPQVSGPGLQFEDMPHYVGSSLSIVTAGDRVHHGTLVAANPKQITLQVRQPGGSASYTLRREQIVRIDSR